MPAPDDVLPDHLAELLLAAVGREAARLAASFSDDGVEVVGNGVVADTVRRLTARAAAGGKGDATRPRVVVDATGDPAELAAATESLADMGALILAGEPLGRRVSLDLYGDVHRRGLRLLGVAPPLQDATAVARLDTADDAADLRPPANVAPGAVVPQALWYRVTAAASA